MKKFLFTLAALLMAGSVCAEEYLFIDGAELTQDQLGTTIDVPVQAHFDCYVSAWELWVNLPEGMTMASWEEGEDLTIEYHNQNGKVKSIDAGVTTTDNQHFICITSATASDYYQVDGAWTYAGCVKWAPGDYAEMLILHIAVAADFAGGNIEVVTEPSCGGDERPEVAELICPKNQHNTHNAEFTVEGGEEPPVEVTATPTIHADVNEEGQYVDIWVEGEGTLKLYIDGFEVANHFHYAFQDEEDVVVVTATAQEEGKEISETAELEVTIPAKTVEPPTPEVTEAPVITSVDDDEAQHTTVTATGNGHIRLYQDDILVAEGEGSASYVIAYGEMEEEYGFSATAQEEGKEVSEYALATIYVPAATVLPPEPYETPAPEVSYEVTETQVIFTATGEGTVNLYVKEMTRDEEEPIVNEPVATGEGTVTYAVDRGEEDFYVAAWATAQRDEEALVGISETEYVLIPALDEVGPEDPHAEGYWLVLFDKDGNEVYYELTPGQGIQIALDYGTFGGFNAEEDPNNPMVPYYILVDGVRYGAETEDAETHMGPMEQTLQNPLVEGENNYVVPTGFNYLMGVYVDNDGNMFVMCAQAGYVGVDELLNGKTVAGVRYFNMAGQEMQEANGVTIIVTTYTDGTTSAVKVMK